mmetsp:Transcript_62321/g.92545  ORF Transcript_62321/g.92545 Transcript_62321/m.92545 type:complete len:117 (+) Transcript_62321:230-580(+)
MRVGYGGRKHVQITIFQHHKQSSGFMIFFIILSCWKLKNRLGNICLSMINIFLFLVTVGSCLGCVASLFHARGGINILSFATLLYVCKHLQNWRMEHCRKPSVFLATLRNKILVFM